MTRVDSVFRAEVKGYYKQNNLIDFDSFTSVQVDTVTTLRVVGCERPIGCSTSMPRALWRRYLDR